MRTFLRTLQLGLALLLTSTAAAQEFPAELAARLDSTLDAVLARTGIMGATAAIVSPRYGTWTGVAGMSSAQAAEAVTPEMLFGIGSITKTFTAAATLALVGEGRIALSDTIGRWITGYPNISGAITIRQLLSHTSGLYNYTDSDGFWEYTDADLDRHITVDDALQFVGPPNFSPGFSWRYSNTGFALLGRIIESVTGRTYDEEIAARFTGPLGLASITMGYNDELPGTLSGNWVDYTGDGVLDDFRLLPRRAIYSGAWAAGGLVSTARDLAHWGDNLYGGRILSPAMMDSMTTFRSIPGLGGGGGYGLGVMRRAVAGRVAIGHGGAIPAFNSILWHFPGDSVTIAVIVNQNQNAPELIADLLARELFRVSAAPNDGVSRDVAIASPNPFTGSTRVTYAARQGDPATLRIYTSIGTPVRTLVDDAGAAGSASVTWDGRDDDGAELPSGAYLLRIESGTDRSTHVLIKR